jgi:hypothetical protein
MPLYVINTNELFRKRDKRAQEWFAAALATLHAETFHTNPFAVRVEYTFIDYESHMRYVGVP